MGKRIVIVDDALFMRNVLKDMLTTRGYDVVAEGKNGIEAVELYQKYHPDLITLDITMPEMTGMQALQEIRAIDSEAKVIMCSAMGQSSMVVKAIQQGAMDFIVKPFQVATVMEAIRRCIG